MNLKVEMSDAKFLKNIDKFKIEIEKNNTFIFYFNHDPDAIGSSIALSLYLIRKNKECILYLPDDIDTSLDFLLDIAKYNNINIIKDVKKIIDTIIKKRAAIITADTATHLLLPHFNEISEIINKEEIVSVEIDHHFGGDSEQIYDNSIELFKESNSTCEITADLLEQIGRIENGSLDYDKVFPRNIVLSLLVGICFDTQLGKFVSNKEIYNKWFEFLSERLKWLTWGNPNFVRNAMQVFDAINKISKNKRKIIINMVKATTIINKVGLLIIPPYKKYESLDKKGDPTCVLAKIIPDLANKVPEYSGAIGIVAFHDTVFDLYYAKVRRSSKFKKYDLRNCETILKRIFLDNYIGGGGHAGATSFRIKNIAREEFIKKMNGFHKELASIIENVLFNKTG